MNFSRCKFKQKQMNFFFFGCQMRLQINKKTITLFFFFFFSFLSSNHFFFRIFISTFRLIFLSLSLSLCLVVKLVFPFFFVSPPPILHAVCWKWMGNKIDSNKHLRLFFSHSSFTWPVYRRARYRSSLCNKSNHYRRQWSFPFFKIIKSAKLLHPKGKFSFHC